MQFYSTFTRIFYRKEASVILSLLADIEHRNSLAVWNILKPGRKSYVNQQTRARLSVDINSWHLTRLGSCTTASWQLVFTSNDNKKVFIFCKYGFLFQRTCQRTLMLKMWQCSKKKMAQGFSRVEGHVFNWLTFEGNSRNLKRRRQGRRANRRVLRL